MNLLKKSPYYVVFGGAVTVFITLGLNHSNGLFLLPITKELGSGRELFSLAGAFGILFSGIGAPIFGGFSDKYGAGRTIFVLGILQILSWIWVGNINSEFDLFGSRILMGIGASGVLGIALSITGRAINSKNKSLFLGIIMASGSFGQFVMVPIINYLINNFGWVYSSIAASFLISPLLIMSILISKNSSSPSFINNDQTIYESLKNAANNNSYKLLTTGFFVCGFHVTFVSTHLPAFLSDNNLQESLAGFALALIGLFNIFGTLSFGYLGSRISKKNLLSVLYSLRSLLFLSFIVAPKNEFTVLVFSATLGILWLSTVPLTNGIITDIFGHKYSSMLFGFTLMSHHIGSFLGSWLGGRMFDLYGSYAPVWWLCVILGFISALIHFPINTNTILSNDNKSTIRT
tara:strand:- start:1172 stop:2383 length:1212 start_codon:yes stop_codon:yes gene_type:complete